MTKSLFERGGVFHGFFRHKRWACALPCLFVLLACTRTDETSSDVASVDEYAESSVAQRLGADQEPGVGESTLAAPTSERPSAENAPDGASGDEVAGPSASLLWSGMRRAGYAEALEQDLALFVPVPPGANGVGGVFQSEDGRRTEVLWLRYPNAHYARPHLGDVRERLLVVDGLTEAASLEGQEVLHLRSSSPAEAARVLIALEPLLGWSSDPSRVRALPDMASGGPH